MENVYVDHYSIVQGFRFYTLCNYPEAYLLPDVIINNLTIDSSNIEEHVAFKPTSYLMYTGPGNFTATNWNATNAWNLASSGISSVAIFQDQN